MGGCARGAIMWNRLMWRINSLACALACRHDNPDGDSGAWAHAKIEREEVMRCTDRSTRTKELSCVLSGH